MKSVNIAIIISGPSGVGKSTIIYELLRQIEWKIHKSITTRPIRHENDYLEYDFCTHNEFELYIEQNKFMEHAKVYDNYYGKPHIPNNLQHNIIFNIDVQGAQTLMKTLNIPFISIFILPPSLEELKHRLIKRNNTLDCNYNTRISTALHEMQQANLFDYIVINNDIKHVANQIINIHNLYISQYKAKSLLTELINQ